VWCNPRRREETGRHPRASREAGTRRMQVRWEPTHGDQPDQPSCLTGSASSDGPHSEVGTCDEDIKSCEHPLTPEVISIGIGRGLTASPLPHHRTYGSRLRRFGRFSQGDTCTPTGASSPGVPAASSSQRPSIARPLAGCHLAAPPQATTALYRSGLQPAIACLLCPLLTSAVRSGRIPLPSVPCEDTPQISRGKLSCLPCIGAGFIKHAPTVDGGLCGRVPTRPGRTIPHIRFVSLDPHVRSTLPSDPTSR
jgi:hypothetical protein